MGYGVLACGRPVRLWCLLRSSSSSFSSSSPCSAALERPDVAKLADAARISVAPDEVEDFAPKIQKVVEWFGQLQAIDLDSIEPSLRAETEVVNDSREDVAEAFENREAILAAIPSFDKPYIKVPKVLNKE